MRGEDGPRAARGDLKVARYEEARPRGEGSRLEGKNEEMAAVGESSDGGEGWQHRQTT